MENKNRILTYVKVLIKMKNSFLNIMLAGLSGILSFLAFPPFEWSFLGWVCLVPLLFVIKICGGYKKAFIYSFLTGVIFFGCLLSWLVNVTIPGMIILILALSLIYGLFGLAVSYAFRFSASLFFIPFIWVVLEYLREFLFTGFPWGGIGYSQYKNINLIQIADLTGVYGISFLLAVFNTAIFSLLAKFGKSRVYLVSSLIFIIMTAIYGVYKVNENCIFPGPKISVVQGNIPQSYKWDSAFADEIIEKYNNLTMQISGASCDIVVWPETAYPYLLEDKEETIPGINVSLEGQNISLLTGVVFEKDNNCYNSAVLLDGNGKIKDVYHKIHLVPFGEYVPFEKFFSFLREYVDKPIGAFKKGETYTLFLIKVVTLSEEEGVRRRETVFYKFGVLICFEDIFPRLARGFVKRGADFLVNITNDAWFGKTSAPYQHLMASVYRAVENRVPMVRAANTGISCFIDSFGRIKSVVNASGEEIFVSGTITDNVYMYFGRKSFYTLHGNIFVYFCIFMCLILPARILTRLKYDILPE